MKDSRDFTRRKRKFLYPYCTVNIRREIRLGSNRKAEKNQGKGCNNPILSPCCCCYCLFRVRLPRVTDFDREIVGRSILTFQILEDLEWNDRERCAETRRRTIFYHDRLSGCQVKFLFVFVFGKGNARRLKRNGAEIRARGKRDLVGRIKVPCPMQIRSARVGFDGTWRDCGHRLPTARLISSRYVVVAVTQARNSRELLEIHRTSRPATRDPLYTTVSVQSRWTFVSTKLKTRFRLRFREIQARLNHSGAGRKFLTRRWRNRQNSTSSG